MWGPNGFTNTIHEMAVRPGGVWRFIMHGPDGTDYPNYIVFDEIVRPERLTYAHGIDANNPPEFHVTVTFEEESRGTRVTLRLVTETAEACDKIKASGAVEGGKQTLNRLEVYLKTMASA